MARNIIDLICNSCSCGKEEAQEYLDDEIRNLQELQEDNVSIRFTTYFLEVFENIWDKIWRN